MLVGLEHIVALLEPVCFEALDVVSRADCWAIATNIAIELAGLFHFLSSLLLFFFIFYIFFSLQVSCDLNFMSFYLSQVANLFPSAMAEWTVQSTSQEEMRGFSPQHTPVAILGITYGILLEPLGQGRTVYNMKSHRSTACPCPSWAQPRGTGEMATRVHGYSFFFFLCG